ncbi:MAG: protein-glutamate O-methyltransferase [Polyangiaceae bacterium]
METPEYHPLALPAGLLPAYTEAELSRTEFNRLAEFIEVEYGIRITEAKKIMLEGRLRKRLRALGFDRFGPYIDRVLGGDLDERVHMIDEVTTNTTHFFREASHFKYLVETAVPTLVNERKPGPPGELRVWSSACSSGEEPYTLAMVLSESCPAYPTLRWRILATDLSTEVLERAIHATYSEERVAPVPLPLRQKYLLRKADGSPVVRIRPQLRERVTFKQWNLLEPNFDALGPMEIIFCRNVFIYFDKSLQAEILRKFERALVPGGYLFLGHSETVNGREVDLVPVRPTVYRKAVES